MAAGGLDATERRHAEALDAADPLAGWRAQFHLPVGEDGRTRTYLAGQSLGAQPIAARAAVDADLEAWARRGVDGWFEGSAAWIEADGRLREATGRLVGARPDEVATLNTLTINLHLLLASFYRPTGARRAVLIDAPTFPSDRYAVESHLRLRGIDPAEDLVVVRPRSGEATLRPEDLEAAVHEHRDRLALALFAGVNYATGQAFDVGRLTAAVHETGAICGWDLAHAAGNVPLRLHDDGVDFAGWCTYKYLNSGPGALGQVFINERHTGQAATTGRLSGWWGNDPATRFEMTEQFRPGAGADGWRVSTPPILALAPIGVSLAMFDEVGIDALRSKSIALTGYLEGLLQVLVPDLEILTPSDPAARGAQLSVRVPAARTRLEALAARGVVADDREPDIIRLAPAPLYNTFVDAWTAAHALAETS